MLEKLSDFVISAFAARPKPPPSAELSGLIEQDAKEPCVPPPAFERFRAQKSAGLVAEVGPIRMAPHERRIRVRIVLAETEHTPAFRILLDSMRLRLSQGQEIGQQLYARSYSPFR
jgi:hypothetical protein